MCFCHVEAYNFYFVDILEPPSPEKEPGNLQSYIIQFSFFLENIVSKIAIMFHTFTRQIASENSINYFHF